jgi:hypothetical protein
MFFNRLIILAERLGAKREKRRPRRDLAKEGRGRKMMRDSRQD